MQKMLLNVLMMLSVPGAHEAFADSTIVLEASREYKPSRSQDGVYQTSSEIQVTIPSELSVLAGNAGNSFAYLSFDRTKCLYQGKSTKANPLMDGSSSKEALAGMSYSFKFCLPDLKSALDLFLSRKPLLVKPGDTIKVQDRIVLHVVNGDHSGITRVQAQIKVKGTAEDSRLLSIQAPQGGSVGTAELLYTIQGTVASSAQQPKVIAGRTVKAYPGETDKVLTLSQDGTFTFDATLFSGPNEFSIRLYQNEILSETAVVNVNQIPTGDAVALVSPTEPSTLEVTDSSLSTVGTSWTIPAGAATRSFHASIHDDRGHWVALPQDVVQVGTGATFFPISEEFQSNVKFNLPVTASMIPVGQDITDVEILALDSDLVTGRDKWIALPVSERSSEKVTFSGQGVEFYALVPVVRKAIQSGEVQIFTNVPGASIYFDGIEIKRGTPTSLKSVTPGTHQIKLYAPGYNEILRTIQTAAEGTQVRVDLVPTEGSASVVTIDPSILDEMTVNQNVATIPGNVTNFGSDASKGFAVISHNGIDALAQVSGGGTFSQVVALQRGVNEISIRYTPESGVTGISRKLRIINGIAAAAVAPQTFSRLSVPQAIPHPVASSPEAGAIRAAKLKSAPAESTVTAPLQGRMSALTLPGSGLGKDIQVTLSWNTAATDVDLHVVDSMGNHTWYSNRTGIPGSLLDVDDVDGYGPEVFTLPNAPAGYYDVSVHYYSDRGNGPSTATVQVRVAGELVHTGSKTLSNGERWQVYSIDIKENAIKLTDVNLTRVFDSLTNGCFSVPERYTNCGSYQFTTATGENSIEVKAEVSGEINPEEVKYQVTNLTDQTPVNTDQQKGLALSFLATNQGITGLTTPRYSQPLMYEIIAYTDSGLQSDPIYIAQDRRSQIRQEFVDKKRFLPSFARLTPAYASIGDGSFYGPTFLTSPFTDADHDYVNFGLTIIRQSRSHYDRIRAAGIPARLTSHWRNPRYNDSLGQSSDSSNNSYHQTGDAIDVNPFRNSTMWPEGASTYEQARAVLRSRIGSILSGTTVIFHGEGANEHVHIQP